MLAVGLVTAALCQVQREMTFYSDPVQLRYGQVHNKVQIGSGTGLPLPDDVVARYRERGSVDGPNDGWMAVVGWDVNIVRRGPGGEEVSVPLWDHYNHHYILHIGGEAAMPALGAAVHKHPHFLDMQGRNLRKLQRESGRGAAIQWLSFGGASGAEYRHNPHVYPAPYRTLIRQPEVFAPELHIIKTLPPNTTTHPTGAPSPLLQCPCTPQRKIDPAAGTIDGHVPNPAFGCSPAMLASGNPSCNLTTYEGGWRCCSDGVMLVDTSKCVEKDCAEWPKDEVYVKFTMQYEDHLPNVTLPLFAQACCDVTSSTFGDGNIEYDIPKCPPNTPTVDCVHSFETIQPMDQFNDSITYTLPNGTVLSEGDVEVDLVFAVAHMHVGGIALEMIDAVTNESLCLASRDDGMIVYGNRTVPGDEKGYVVGIYPCVWGGNGTVPPRRRRRHPIRTRAVYNASEGLTGVMSLWLNQVSPVFYGGPIWPQSL